MRAGLLPLRSVQQKLVAMVMVATLAALLVAIVAMIGYDLRLYHKSWIADLSTQAELLARTSAPALAFDDARVANENLALLRHRPKVRAGAIYNARGKLFASYAGEGEHAFPSLPEADGARIEGGELIVFRRVVNEREILGTVYLRAEYELYDRLLGYLGIALLVAAGALLVAYLLSRQLQRIVTRPLLAIADAAREVTEKRNFSLRAEKLSNDEIGLLAESFNTMLAEIDRATRELEASNKEAAREVAERRRAEEEILRLNAELEKRVRERTAQLEYTNGELEAFCFSVSHDLRAPLRAIDGFSQALLEDFPKELPEEAHRYLTRIRSSTQRMAQLIEDLLNLSRVSRGTLDVQDVDVGELSKKVAEELQHRDPGRKVELSIWEGMRAHADPRLLRAALENLIGNAWKFTSKTERPRIEVGALRDGGHTTFFVRDNGAGFDMAYSSKLFGAFQRLHPVNEYQGTGIGLATVQRIVHRHGGRVWADAKPEKGAVFFFTLEPGEAQPAATRVAEAEA
jgi:signal transduction histidine kinase